MKKGKWSKEEDNLIKNHIQKHGIGRSWQGLSNTLGLQRCGRSCRSRWLNYLRPGLKHGNFTPAEDRIICEMYSRRGSCWSVIAAVLPGRTDLAIKNYWNSTLKKRFPRAARNAAAARRRSRPAGSTSSDAASPEHALIIYNEESSTAPDHALVVHNEEASTMAPDLALVVYNEESATTGSSGHAGVIDRPEVLVVSPAPVQAQMQPPVATDGNAENEEPIAAAPISWSARIEQMPPPPADQTSEMDILCASMSPLPLGFMDPDMPCMTGFDDIDSFLSFFD